MWAVGVSAARNDASSADRRAGGIAHSQPMEVPFEESCANEIDQRQLRQSRAAGIEQRLDRAKGLDQRLRHDEVPKAQRREHHLGECPCVQHSPLVVEGLQRLERPTGVAIFAVVIVLEDES